MIKYFIIVLFAGCLASLCCQAQKPDQIVTGSSSGESTTKPSGSGANSNKGGKGQNLPVKKADLIDVTFHSSDAFYLRVNGTDYGKIPGGAPKTIKLAPDYHKLYFESAETGETLKPPFELRKDMATNGKYSYPVTFNQKLSGAGKSASTSPKNGSTNAANSGPAQHASVVNKANEKEQATIAKLAADVVFVAGGSLDKASEKVAIKPLHVGKYEVTQQQWEAIMGYNNSGNKGCSECPVENVSWNEADSFIRKINSTGTKRFRLPTEAEWEYVARKSLEETVGNTGGSKADQKKVKSFLETIAWYDGTVKNTQPVGRKQPVSGIFDLFGNVAEWCTESPSGSKSKGLNDLLGLGARDKKVVKGGSYKDSDDRLRPQSASKENASAQEKTIGFRLVLEAD